MFVTHCLQQLGPAALAPAAAPLEGSGSYIEERADQDIFRTVGRDERELDAAPSGRRATAIELAATTWSPTWSRGCGCGVEARLAASVAVARRGLRPLGTRRAVAYGVGRAARPTAWSCGCGDAPAMAGLPSWPAQRVTG